MSPLITSKIVATIYDLSPFLLLLLYGNAAPLPSVVVFCRTGLDTLSRPLAHSRRHPPQ
jgi:hypothetical protein